MQGEAVLAVSVEQLHRSKLRTKFSAMQSCISKYHIVTALNLQFKAKVYVTQFFTSGELEIEESKTVVVEACSRLSHTDLQHVLGVGFTLQHSWGCFFFLTHSLEKLSFLLRGKYIS